MGITGVSYGRITNIIQEAARSKSWNNLWYHEMVHDGSVQEEGLQFGVLQHTKVELETCKGDSK